VNIMPSSTASVSTAPQPVPVGLAGVELADGGPTIRLLPFHDGWFAAYDRRRWSEDDAAEIVRLILEVPEIEVITAAPEALR
jgi:hypothetical protein